MTRADRNQRVGLDMDMPADERQILVVDKRVETAVHHTLEAFAEGLSGERTKNLVSEMAARITKAALDKTVEPEITVDVDGALSFDLRLADGRLVLAELELSGALDASVYDQQGSLVRRLRQATEPELTGLF